MTAKPTEIPQWATDGTNNDEPSTGQKESGWTVGQIPTSDAFNWWQNTVYLWVNWLNASTVEFGSSSVSADSFAADNDLYGITLHADEITNNGAAQIDIDTHIVMAANQNITLSGTGAYKHGDKKIVVPASAFQLRDGGTVTFEAGYLDFAAFSEIFAPIPLPDGCRVRSIKWFYDRGGSNNLVLAYKKQQAGSSATDIDTATISSGSGWTSEDSTGIDYTLGSDTDYNTYLHVTGNGPHQFSHAIITYDRP